MADGNGIVVAKGAQWLRLPLAVANRHGLIAGATGTGKTVTLRTLAEGFSAAGVPVFMADVKGDLAGMCQPGGDNPKIAERVRQLGMADFAPTAWPTMFWDLFGEQGHPIRATVSEMGPLLLARLLELNETQAGVLNIAFKLADDNGLLLIDLKDLRAMLQYIAEQAPTLTATYGNVGTSSVGAIQRGLLALQTQGGDKFFGEPALEFADLMRVDGRGRGLVSILAADKLMLRPKLYATFLLWLLSELYELLPEEGDLDRPKLVFFFDEAHLLFTDAPPPLLEKVEQVVRLVRSKGVGVYFVTQNPLDIPATVLGQLGNKVQHALRAFTPKDQKAVRAAAETFRANPKLDTATAILELAVGEGLVSLLDERGTPAPVERALIAPPCSRLGTITPAERKTVIGASPLAGKYEDPVERESAFEQLGGQAPQAQGGAAPAQAPPAGGGGLFGGLADALGGILGVGRTPPPARPTLGGGRATGRPQPSIGDMVVKSVARNIAGSVGRQIGTQIVRGILGSILKR